MKISLAVAASILVALSSTGVAMASDDGGSGRATTADIMFRADAGPEAFVANLTTEGVLPELGSATANSFTASVVLVTAKGIKLIPVVKDSPDLATLLSEQGYSLGAFRSEKGAKLTDRKVTNGERLFLYETTYTGVTKKILIPRPIEEVKTDYLPTGVKQTLAPGADGLALETTVTEVDPINPKKTVETVTTSIIDAPKVKKMEVGKATKLTRVPCTNGTSISARSSSWAYVAYQATCHVFPEIKPIGSYRAGKGQQDHGTGTALDIMTYRDDVRGDKIAEFFKVNHKAFNVKYIIWHQKIWSPEKASQGWRAMEDRGSRTANHFDHVHLSLNTLDPLPAGSRTTARR